MRVRGSTGAGVQGILLFIFLVVATLLDGTKAMYCGDRNCYDVLKYVIQVYCSVKMTAVPPPFVSCPDAEAHDKLCCWSGSPPERLVLHRVKENANKTEIIISYRKLARQWHPDKNQHRAVLADKEFSAIAHAYEILRNDLSRRDYDYALRHPELFAYNQAKYFYTQFYSRHMKV